MPHGIGDNPGVKAKTNPTGRGGALGLLSEKLAQGIGNRRRKRRAGQQQQTLQQRSLPKTRIDKNKVGREQQSASMDSQVQNANAKNQMSQVQSLMKMKSEQSSNRKSSGPIAPIASALK